MSRSQVSDFIANEADVGMNDLDIDDGDDEPTRDDLESDGDEPTQSDNDFLTEGSESERVTDDEDPDNPVVGHVSAAGFQPFAGHEHRELKAGWRFKVRLLHTVKSGCVSKPNQRRTMHSASRIAQRVPAPEPGCHILDVGCGDGHQAAAYWRDTNVAFIAVTDVSPRALASVRQTLNAIRPLTNQNSSGVLGKLGGTAPMPQDLRNALSRQGLRVEFDIIVLDRILHHIHPNRHAQVLDQLAELLNANGRLVFSRLHHPLCPGIAYSTHCTRAAGSAPTVHNTASVQVAPTTLYE